jgi:hypothetical protein
MFDFSCVSFDENCRRPEASSLPTIDPERTADEAATQKRRNPEQEGLGMLLPPSPQLRHRHGLPAPE